MLILQYKVGLGPPVIAEFGDVVASFEPYVLDDTIFTHRVEPSFRPSTIDHAFGSPTTISAFATTVDDTGSMGIPATPPSFGPGIQSQSEQTGGSQDPNAWWLGSSASSDCIDNVTVIQYPSYTTPAQNSTIGTLLGGGNPCTP